MTWTDWMMVMVVFVCTIVGVLLGALVVWAIDQHVQNKKRGPW